MKFFLTFILLVLPIFIFGQNLKYKNLVYKDSLGETKPLYKSYERLKFMSDSLSITDSSIQILENDRKEFAEAYVKLLDLNDYSSVKLQNAILNDYLTKNNIKPLTKNFKDRTAVEKRIIDIDEYFIATISNKHLINLKTNIENSSKQLNDYIDKNLRRLKISRKEFDSLSDNDRNLLFNEFKD